MTDPSPYHGLEALPASLRGELLNGKLRTQPRPSAREVLVISSVSAELHHAYQKGHDSHWWILRQPEVHFALDNTVLIPDVAGWVKSRMPRMPENAKFTTVPDWVCEVVSSSTEQAVQDERKLIYAKQGVQHLWLVDPDKVMVEICNSHNGQWQSIGQYRGDDMVSPEPFPKLAVSACALIGLK